MTVKFSDSSKQITKLEGDAKKQDVELLLKDVRNEFVKCDEMFNFVHVIFWLLLTSSSPNSPMIN